MSMPNGPQTNPQFQNKPPYNFNNNAGYDDQNKDYSNYNPQSQIKTSGYLSFELFNLKNLKNVKTLFFFVVVHQASNLNNVSEIGGVSYQKNVDKSNTGYHTPPPNYSNSLNNQPHPNVSGNAGVPPPAVYPYMTSMIAAPGANQLVHNAIQQV